MSQLLLIEPDRVLSKSYKVALEHAGHRVVVAREAQQAINKADKLRPDLIIVELQLISHSGIEFLYELRSYSEWQNIPVLILSVVPVQEFSNNIELISKELNISGYLYKPTTKLKGLIDRVDKILK